jgi:outer membrane protein
MRPALNIAAFLLIALIAGIGIRPSYAQDLAEPVDDETAESTENLLEEDFESALTFTMEGAVEWALEYNGDIAEQRSTVEAAEAAERSTRLLYYPTLDVGGRLSSIGPSNTVTLPIPGVQPISIQLSNTDITSSFNLSLTQPVYMFGAFDLAQRGSSLSLQQARLQLVRLEQTVRRDVEEAYLHAALADALADVAQKAVDTARERLRIAEARFDEGDVARFEVLRSEVSVATAQENLLQAETGADLAMSALVQKMGLPSGTEIEIIPPDPDEADLSPPDVTLEQAKFIALANRDDIRALELGLDLAEVGILNQRNRPSLVFQGNYSRADRASGFQQKENWSLILNLNYTLFDSGRARASMDEARARRDALMSRLDEVRSLVELEVENSYLTLVQALERIEVARTTLASAQEALRIAELGYTEGVITYIDYQDADLGLRQAETQYLRAVYEYLIAESNLEAAMGRNDVEN